MLGRNRPPSVSQGAFYHDLYPCPVRKELTYQRAEGHREEEEDSVRMDDAADAVAEKLLKPDHSSGLWFGRHGS